MLKSALSWIIPNDYQVIYSEMYLVSQANKELNIKRQLANVSNKNNTQNTFQKNWGIK